MHKILQLHRMETHVVVSLVPYLTMALLISPYLINGRISAYLVVQETYLISPILPEEQLAILVQVLFLRMEDYTFLPFHSEIYKQAHLSNIKIAHE